jgi:hypothetical protein
MKQIKNFEKKMEDREDDMVEFDSIEEECLEGLMLDKYVPEYFSSCHVEKKGHFQFSRVLNRPGLWKKIPFGFCSFYTAGPYVVRLDIDRDFYNVKKPWWIFSLLKNGDVIFEKQSVGNECVNAAFDEFKEYLCRREPQLPKIECKSPFTFFKVKGIEMENEQREQEQRHCKMKRLAEACLEELGVDDSEEFFTQHLRFLQNKKIKF